MSDVTLIEASTHCPMCKAEYENIQHPMKPLGVSVQRLCKCKLTVTTTNGVSVTSLAPPQE